VALALCEEIGDPEAAGRAWADPDPDRGLKTRGYTEVGPALRHLVAAARRVRAQVWPGPL
jgi:methionine synthase II (cobalamin-independent)